VTARVTAHSSEVHRAGVHRDKAAIGEAAASCRSGICRKQAGFANRTLERISAEEARTLIRIKGLLARTPAESEWSRSQAPSLAVIDLNGAPKTNPS
jgi:hypothetical protein